MTKIKRYVVFVSVFLFALGLFSNGGPIKSYGLGSAGNIQFIRKKNIELMNESVFVKIEGREVKYEIKYTFANKGETEKITFAFPMEVIIEDFNIDSEKERKAFIDKELKKSRVSSYKLSVNKKALPYKIKAEAHKLKEGGYLVKEWFVSEIELGKGLKTEVVISFSAASQGDLSFYSCSALPEFSERKINYDFYPASFFGEGTVQHLTVRIDFSEILKMNGKVLKYEGLDFKKSENGVFLFSGKKINLKKTKGFSFSYDMSRKEKFDYFNKIRMGHDKLKILKPDADSSELLKMFDSNLETTYCLKKGQEIELFFDKNVLPGYGGLIMKDSKEDEFKIDVNVECCGFKGNESFIYSSENFRECDLCSKSKCEFKKKSDCLYYTDCMSDLFDLGDYDATKVEKCQVKIKITPEKAGQNESCIGEIIILPYYQGN